MSLDTYVVIFGIKNIRDDILILNDLYLKGMKQKTFLKMYFNFMCKKRKKTKKRKK
jgi:hypothetical protein